MVKDTGDVPGETKEDVSPEMKSPDYLFKILVTGEARVGKTSLVQRNQNGSFNPNYIPTIGVDFVVKSVKTKDGEVAKLQNWDVSGQQRFRTITNSYYRGVHGLFLVYDVTRRETFEHAARHLNEAREMTMEDCVYVLVGNKADNDDSSRQVSKAEGAEFAIDHGLEFAETSAKDNLRVDEMFHFLVEKLIDVYKAKHAILKTKLKNRAVAITKTKRKNSKEMLTSTVTCTCCIL